VLSAVIRLSRNEALHLDCDEKLFWQVVKAGFNQRRKTLSNALSGIIPKEKQDDQNVWTLRAERLSVSDFVELTQNISLKIK
jgi:16S rRNA (adenine1518-N6/adenine1519-N6)-dimethyltransferase